jgi:hypothetical protein
MESAPKRRAKTTVKNTTGKSTARTGASRKPAIKSAGKLEGPSLNKKRLSGKKTLLKEKAEKTFFQAKPDVLTGNQTTEVSLPETVSLRLKRKATLISNLSVHDLSGPSWKVAYSAGLFFILFGSIVSAANTPSIVSMVETKLAATITDAVNSTTNNITTNQTATLSAPVVKLGSSTPVPSPLTVDKEYVVETLHVSEVSLYLDGPTRINLTPTSPGPNYHIFIAASSLETGYYKLKANFVGLDGTHVTGRTLASFDVPSPVGDPQADLLTNLTSLTNDMLVTVLVKFVDNLEFSLTKQDDSLFNNNLNFTNGQNFGEFKVQIPASTLEPATYDLHLKGDSIKDNSEYAAVLGTFTKVGASEATEVTATEISLEEDVMEVEEEDVALPVESTSTSTEIKVELKTYTSEFTKPDTIHVFAPLRADLVQIYYRKEKSITLSPLGYALKGKDRWLYRFDPVNLPNGKYYLSAKVKIDKSIFVSNSVGVSIYLPAPADTLVPENTVINETSESPTEIMPVESSASAINQVKAVETERPFVPSESIDDTSITSSSTFAFSETRDLLAEFKPEIDVLLKNYAVAVQSGDLILIDAAKKELEKKRDELIELALIDSELRVFADSIGQRLREHIQILQSSIETFEQLRKKDTDNDSAIDTDGDGISDFDERVLFKTDPNSADTDGDGVLDGIEIIGGFDPLNSEPEASIIYESPREKIAYVANDVLVVNTVTPIIREDVSDTIKPVAAEIRGKGIPNSFVTLYIFSTPTVVTVKTDADGSFVYTFEDELEDGEHEVYVAVTDNTGGIVAQSNPFRFVKEAQAFTAEGDNGQIPLTSNIDKTITGNPYISVAGLGVLGLGLVLLILGFALRNFPTKPVIRENITA